MPPIEEYLHKIRPYLSNMMNDLKEQGEWQIQLSITINFLSSKNTSETHTMHSKSDNKDVVISSEI